MGRLKVDLKKCSLNAYASCCLICIPISGRAVTCICIYTTDSDRGTDVAGKGMKAFEHVESQALHGTILEVLRYHGSEHMPSFENWPTVSEHCTGMNVVLSNFI